MSLSGQQQKKLQKALIDAFPTTASLEQMLTFELDKNLEAIAGKGSLQDIVFQLIRRANAEGWIKGLVRAACESNPGNPQLKSIAEELLTIEKQESSSKFKNEAEPIIFSHYKKYGNCKLNRNNYKTLEIYRENLGLSKKEADDKIQEIVKSLEDSSKRLEDKIKGYLDMLDSLKGKRDEFYEDFCYRRDALGLGEETEYNGRILGDELLSVNLAKIGHERLSKVFENTGNDCSVQNQLSNAQVIFELAQDFNPSNFLIYKGYASIYFKKTKYTDALKALIQARDLLSKEEEEELNCINDCINNNVPMTNHIFYYFREHLLPKIKFLMGLSNFMG